MPTREPPRSPPARGDPLTPEQFERLRDAFLAADEGFPAGSEDPEIDRLVEAMRRGDAAPRRSALDLDRPIAALAGAIDLGLGADLRATPGRAPPPLLPERIGPYRILGVLGCGGVGDVCLAEQEEPVRRRVAVKILRFGLAGRAPAERFAREARALSALSHPGIARILDAGRLPDGRPYLVMDHIDGEPVDAYADRRRLSPEERIRLVLRLCEPVQHAHQRGVIHRDLTPANILVTEESGEPWVHVIDFGVARLLEADGPGRSPTLQGQVIGTPGYMSPEQLRGEPADVRSDVYALGVLLHRLLTGRLPLAGVPLAMPEAPARLRRDVRAVVARAAAADPDDRYPSAGHLAEDLHCLLAARPVRARRASPGYVLARLARRRPWSTAAAIAGSAMLLAAGGMLANANAHLRAQRRAEQAIISATVNEVLDKLGVVAGTASSREAIARPMLDRVEAMLANHPDAPDLLETKARLLRHLGDIAEEHGRDQDALGRHAEAVAILDEIAPFRAGDLAFERWHASCRVRLGDALLHTGDPDAALHIYRAVEATHTAMRARHPTHLGVADDLCWSYDRLIPPAREAGDAARLDALLAERLRLAEWMVERDPTRVLSLHNLATAHLHAAQRAEEQGALEHALASVDESVRFARFALQADPNRVHFALGLSTALRTRATVLSRLGRASETEDAVREACRLLEPMLESDQGRRLDILHHLASAYAHLARIVAEDARPDEARRLARTVLAIFQQIPPDAAPGDAEGAEAAARSLLDQLGP